MTLRVLHVLPTRASSYGGPVRVAEGLAAHTAAHGIQSTLFPGEGEETEARLLFAPTPAQTARLLSQVRAAQLVHIHGLWTVPTTLAAQLCRALRRPYVLTPHGMLDRWSLSRSAGKKRIYAAAVERSTLRGARALHFFNEEEATEARDFGELPPHFLLPNGVDVAAFSALPGRGELDARWPMARGRTLALFLGRIHPKKGFDVLVPALEHARLSQLLLVVAGPDEGGYRREVERLAQTANLSAQLLFVGPVEGDAKRALLGGADFFVLPSHQEGDSVAIKEALAAGLPVLISDRCHLPEAETEGAGLVVPDTVDAVAAALIALTSQDNQPRRHAARALAARFDLAALGEKLSNIYRAIASAKELPQ